MRPTQQATKLARSRDGDPRVETPSSFLSTQTSKFGPVSRLQKLIETRSSKNFGQKSEIQFSHTVADPKRPELKNVEFSFKMADCSLQSCGPCYKANMVVGTVGKVSLAVYFINKRTPPKVSIWSATV